jgi:hypothetical protein
MRPQSAARGPEPAVQFGRALDANGQAHPRGRDSQESEASPHAGSASGVGAEALPVIEVTPQLWEAFAAWDVPDPDSGQVWRLRWNDVVALAVIDLRRDHRRFRCCRSARIRSSQPTLTSSWSRGSPRSTCRPWWGSPWRWCSTDVSWTAAWAELELGSRSGSRFRRLDGIGVVGGR